MSSIEISAFDSSGQSMPLQSHQLSRRFSPDRLRGLIQHILRNSEAAQLQTRLKAFWGLWAQQDAGLQRATSVRFYRVTLVTVPERRMENPIHRELLFEWEIQRNQTQRIGKFVPGVPRACWRAQLQSLSSDPSPGRRRKNPFM